jgi:hypothetical protein
MRNSGTKEKLLPLPIIVLLALGLLVLLTLGLLVLLASNDGQLSEFDRVLGLALALVDSSGRSVASVGDLVIHVVERDHGLLVLHRRSIFHLFVFGGLVVESGIEVAFTLPLSLALAVVLGGDSDGLGFFILGHRLLDLLVESLRALLDGSILCAAT